MPLLLDAYAVIALLRGEPAARELRAHLDKGETVVHPLNLAEVIDRLVRVDGRDADDIEADVALLNISVETPGRNRLIDAGRLRSRHYRKGESEVSLADCVAASHALVQEYPLATSDAPLARMMRSEGGEVFPLPNSKGERP